MNRLFVPQGTSTSGCIDEVIGAHLPQGQALRRIVFGACVSLVVLLAAGCEKSTPSASVVSTNKCYVEINPLPGLMQDVLEIPVDKDLIVIWRCEFTAHHTRSIELKLVAVKGHTGSELARVTVPTIEAKNKPLKGTVYLAFIARGRDESTPERILALGISTESTRQSVPSRGFTIDPALTSKIGLQPAKSIILPSGVETAIWGTYLTRRTQSKEVKAVDEVLAERAPFESSDPAQITDAAKALDNGVTFFATVTGNP